MNLGEKIIARKHIEPFVDRDVGFKRLELKGIPSGCKYKMLSIDEDSGACTMSVQRDAGCRQPPSVSYSEYEIFIMDDAMKIGDQVCAKGEYFFLPRGVSLPAFSTDKGCFALVMYNDSEPHILESDEDRSGVNRDGLIQSTEFWVSGARTTICTTIFTTTLFPTRTKTPPAPPPD
ncbi:MAG: hypothetical protein LH472_11275 [Pyrinomonadaceae bacterium]|nr:hypothetical protein [Pyrinomonadaceae bacterium]